MAEHQSNYSRSLALDEFSEYEAAAQAVLRRLGDHINAATKGDLPATGYAPLSQILDHLKIEHWIESGGMDVGCFDQFLNDYLHYSVQFHNPRYIAHQVSIPDYPGALAAMVNGVTNNPMAIYEMGPAAATMEFAVINWMLRKVGWTEQARPGSAPTSNPGGGVLTHGGSLANLTALLAARARIAPDAWEFGTPRDLAVLVPPTSHYSVARAVAILGLGSRAIYHLGVNRNGVVEADSLASSLDKVQRDGRRCMAVVANTCATATGLHDPLRAIGEFCQAHGIWLHADACHGATALLGESRHHLDGIELADSMVWDTHKMMQVPTLCAAVLLKDGADFDRAFHQQASYLAYGHDQDAYDSLPRAIECTKAALGLKVFLTLAWRGEQALGDYVDNRYRVTAQFHDQIQQRPGFECLCQPESNILCFRYDIDDAAQQAIRDELVRTREFHLTSAQVAGQTWLRLTVMNKLTDAGTIDQMLDAIEQAARSL